MSETKKYVLLEPVHYDRDSKGFMFHSSYRVIAGTMIESLQPIYDNLGNIEPGFKCILSDKQEEIIIYHPVDLMEVNSENAEKMGEYVKLKRELILFKEKVRQEKEKLPKSEPWLDWDKKENL